MIAIAEYARAAAEAAARLAEAAGHAGPGIPLAGYLVPLRDIRDAADAAADGLLHAASLASGILAGPGAAGGARKALADAAAKTGSASDQIGGAADTIRHDLSRAAPIGPGGSTGELLYDRAYRTRKLLEELRDSYERTPRGPGTWPVLTGLETAAMHQATVATHLSRACDLLQSSIFTAYRQMPGRPSGIRAVRQLDRAAADLERAAAGIRRARHVLGGELAGAGPAERAVP